MAYFLWIFLFLFFLLFSFNTCSSSESTEFDFPSAPFPNRWVNDPDMENSAWTFDDGTHVSPILAVSSKNGDPIFGFGFLRKGTLDNAFYLSVIKFPVIIFSDFHDYDTSAIVVWTANRDTPVKEDAVLQLTEEGDMVLTDARDGARVTVWSTNTAGSNASRLYLSKDGNLMILDSSNATIWQSFDFPTDTWIPRQGLRFQQVLVSSVSSFNFSRGIYYVSVGPDSIQAFFNSSQAPQMYRSVSLPTQGIYNFSIGFLNYTNGFAYYQTAGAGGEGDFQYITLEPNGHLNVYQVVNGSSVLISNLLQDGEFGECIYPTVCGNYGVCYHGECTCPGESIKSERYFRPINASQPSSGCAEVNSLSCEDSKLHALVDLKNVTYFTLEPSILNTDMEGCKMECLKNCSCRAALFRYEANVSNGNCSLVSTQLFSLIAVGESESNYSNFAFIKVQKPAERNKALLVLILVPCLSAVTILMITIMGAYWYAKRKKRDGLAEQTGESSGDDSSVNVSYVLRKFSFKDLRSATKDFSMELGRGGFGVVAEGTLENGTKVAVKRLGSTVHQGKREFLAEVKTIGSIHHLNLVRLMGYCAERSNRLLVYEYMSNRSLDKWIFYQERAEYLSWGLRQKIIVGIAKGLEYLHHYCSRSIIHFDIKPQNILLDDDFNAKISDFGLARLFDKDQSHVSSLLKGTPGYIAPELIRGSNITTKIDVYSLGIMILEIICGRRNSDPDGHCLVDIVKLKAEQNQLFDLIDARNEDMLHHREDAVKVMEVAISCLQINFYRRPTAAKVVKLLEGSVEIEPVTDYSFLSMPHIISPATTTQYDTDSAPLSGWMLSGPR